MSKNVLVKQGIVLERRNGDKVTVLVSNDLGCEGCQGSCDSGDTEDHSFKVTAIDTLGVVEGDRVEVEIHPRNFAKVATIVFGIPAGALMVGLGIGTVFSNQFFAGNFSKAFQGGTAGFLFLISIVGLVGYDRYLAARSTTRARITGFSTGSCEAT